MKTRGLLLPLLALATLILGFATDVLLTAHQLPVQLATHFGTDGQANGWMARAGHVRFMLGIGLGVPLSIVLIIAIVSRLGGAGLNIPNRQYWLAPERRAQTLAFVQRQMVWFACLLVLFFVMIHHLILWANAHTPAMLSPSGLWIPIALFLAAIVAWTVAFIRPFRRTS
ncbi:MAG: DUF1648 domain-containing protein [Chthoniobacter sp.]|nr:DUF1648 domain-containing protein [Chthoniobacter sp.]